ncbi:hypothetical protein C4N9_04290 [Pararhodobacter marinus]|uniref:Uncharacterized protein n=1 Tax=Pararhodobacter marinus TaxID=2184063 RepID=A0A2U2CGF5_9RHOB|nr:hypothetical protein [Pararhodobacter marinus]PWE30978.1 hypothetical protein C4N9_04290 [Pararhodobacter marinus]
MTICMQEIAGIRGFRIAALVERSVDVYVSGQARSLAAQGRLVPLAILLAGPGGVRAVAPDGTALSRARVEGLAPGVWERFARGGPGGLPEALPGP